MNLLIKSKNLDFETFIYSHLLNYIYEYIFKSINYSRLSYFSKKFKIDFEKILNYAISNLSVSRLNQYTFKISINKNLVYNSRRVLSYINFLTYGNLGVNGYPLVINSFNYIEDHIDEIYKEWKKYGN